MHNATDQEVQEQKCVAGETETLADILPLLERWLLVRATCFNTLSNCKMADVKKHLFLSSKEEQSIL
jgi:hypothetical protein